MRSGHETDLASRVDGERGLGHPDVGGGGRVRDGREGHPLGGPPVNGALGARPAVRRGVVRVGGRAAGLRAEVQTLSGYATDRGCK